MIQIYYAEQLIMELVYSYIEFELYDMLKYL